MRLVPCGGRCDFELGKTEIVLIADKNNYKLKIKEYKWFKSLSSFDTYKFFLLFY